MSSVYRGMNRMNVCPTCSKPIEYPFCLNKFHDQPRPNKVAENLKEVMERINGWWH